MCQVCWLPRCMKNTRDSLDKHAPKERTCRWPELRDRQALQAAGAVPLAQGLDAVFNKGPSHHEYLKLRNPRGAVVQAVSHSTAGRRVQDVALVHGNCGLVGVEDGYAVAPEDGLCDAVDALTERGRVAACAGAEVQMKAVDGANDAAMELGYLKRY